MGSVGDLRLSKQTYAAKGFTSNVAQLSDLRLGKNVKLSLERRFDTFCDGKSATPGSRQECRLLESELEQPRIPIVLV